MTRKRINLDLATPEWLATQSASVQRLVLDRYSHWKEDDEAAKKWKADAISKEIQRWFLSEAFDYINVEQVSASAMWGIKFETSDSLNAKALNRLMNSEIVFEGKTFVFENLRPEGHMGGDYYMGEPTEFPVHRIEVSYKASK